MYVKNTLTSAPPRAILLGSGDQKFSGFLHARLVLDLRSDVDFLTPEMLHGSWYRERESQTLGVHLASPDPTRRTLLARLLETGRPVAFAGPVPPPIVEAGFTTFPIGTLFVVQPAGTAPPDLYALERKNLELLTEFDLETDAPRTSANWSGATFGEYARGWLALEAAFERLGDKDRAKQCRIRALAFAPWLSPP
jgi:hypothetical protein